MKTAFYAFLCALALGCEKNEETVDHKVMAMSLPAAADEREASVTTEEAQAAFSGSENKIEQKIIRSANLRFECEDLAETNARIIAAVKKYGGYLQNDREAKEYSEVSRTLEVRVPSKNFDSFLNEVSDGVNYFDEKNIASRDVTEEYIDVDSRLRTQKALENRYLELLKKAGKVSEMLEIEAKLSEIRGEIEAKQARLNYLQSQVDMSSFVITFYKNIPQKESASVSFGSKIRNAFATGINGVLDFFIWLLEMWPFILILVALIVFFRKRWRRRQKN